MRYKDYKRLERYSLKYNNMLIRLCLNDEKPIKITMCRRHNMKGHIFTKFFFDVSDRKGHIRTERITANGITYLWILTSATADFPDCEFEDVSAPEFKRVQQPTEEVIN